MDRMYLVTRRDLPAGPQAVQSSHALASYAVEHRASFEAWAGGSNTLVLVSVRDERELGELAARAEACGIPVSRFLEPDYGNALTAIAMVGAKRICRGLRKTLQEIRAP